MFRVVSVSVWAFVSSVKRIGDRTVRREFGQMNPVSQDEYVCKSECCVFLGGVFWCFFSWGGGGGGDRTDYRGFPSKGTVFFFSRDHVKN